MRPTKSLLLLAATAPLALADVEFTVPAAGASVAGGTTFTVTWKDSGTAPSISDLSAYQLFLYTGSNDSPQQLASLVPGSAFTSDSTTVTVAVGIGGSTANAYFLGMISTATAGGTVTNYSDRFTLTGMTGVFSAAVQTALAGVSGTDGPATVNDVTGSGSGTSSAAEAGVYGTPYNQQTGLTKYAPMQPLPGTTITATNTSPLWPTSSVPTATTFLPIPSVQTTITQSATWSFASHANTAAAQSQPTDDMEKFLARWKD